MKNLSPLKAIRKHCLDCSDGAYSEVRECRVADCILHKYRFGKRVTSESLSSLKIIRKCCIDCQGDSLKGVKQCTSNSCALYPFRLGKNPNIKISDEQRKILVQRLATARTHIQCRKTS